MIVKHIKKLTIYGYDCELVSYSGFESSKKFADTVYVYLRKFQSLSYSDYLYFKIYVVLEGFSDNAIAGLVYDAENRTIHISGDNHAELFRNK